MRTRISRISLALVFLSFGTISIVFGGWISIKYYKLPYPEENIKEQVWIPPNAEIYSTEVVRPGTFKITLSLDEFKSLITPEKKVLVVYRDKKFSYAEVHYWLQENGLFKYSSQTLTGGGRLDKKTPYFKWKSIFNKEDRVFEYIPFKNWPLSLFVLCVLTIIGCVLCWVAYCCLFDKLIIKPVSP